MGCSPWGHKESGMTERLTLTYSVEYFHSPQSLLVLRWSQSPGRYMIRQANFKVSAFFVKVLWTVRLNQDLLHCS